MELSRLIGVSPWEWWADATPAKKEIFLTTGFLSEYAVSFRRISGEFLFNDEDVGALPLRSWQTYEPSDVKGQIGPKHMSGFL